MTMYSAQPPDTWRPTEYYVVWEEEQDAGSLAAATRLARRKHAEGKGAVQVRQRTVVSWTDGDGVQHHAVEDDECVQDAFGAQEEGHDGR